MLRIKGVYKIVNIINGDYYLGRANNFFTRWKEHIADLQNNRHDNNLLQRAWNKYGEEAFVFEVVETIPDDLVELEQKYLDNYKGKYNLSGAAVGITSEEAKGENNNFWGKKHTKEVRDKISKASKERWKNNEYRKRVVGARIGRKQSAETILKRTEKVLGQKRKPHTKETKKKIGKASKEYWKNSEYRKKMSEIRTGRKHTEETKKKISEAKKRYWKNFQSY